MNIILGDILSQLNPTVVYIVVAVLVVSTIIAIIKKAIKLAILVAIVTFGVSVLGPMATDFQNKYKFDVSNGVATMQIEGQKFKLNKDEVKKIELVNHGINGYTVNVTYTDGTSTANVPTFMSGMIKSYAEQYKIPINVID